MFRSTARLLTFFALALALFLQASQLVSAQAPHTDNGSCCDANYTYGLGICASNDIPTFCANVVTGAVTSAFGTACSLPLISAACAHFLPPIVTQANVSCTTFVLTAGSVTATGLCGQIFNSIEPTIQGIPIIGPYANDILNAIQAGCQTTVNNFLSSLPATPILIPQCNNPLQCNSTGTCVAPQYAALENPYCDYMTADSGIRTAIGCLTIEAKPLIVILLNWAVGLAGGIGFILIVIAGYMIAMGRGDPKRLQAGHELLFSAIAGLLFIALSIVLLNFIGVSVLGLDSLGFVL